MTRRILALNPWHGGSHKAFLEGWIGHSQHDFTVLSLPARKWKWRMRHSAVTFATQLEAMLADKSNSQPAWDVLLCTDMLGLAEFRGLAPESIRRLPAIVYFHENQLTYPTQQDEERDFHFAYSNMTSALAADSVWFNSAYHRDDFLSALRDLLRRMPDFEHRESPDKILARSFVQPPGIDVPAAHRTEAQHCQRVAGPLRIVWASRWEHDKNPELFFAALAELSKQNVPFQISVLGESFHNSPACFELARQQLAPHIRHWGYANDRADYFRTLAESDVVVSTARHEFFGISVLEAVIAGCFPLVPNQLAYPETIGPNPDCFHDGTVGGIAAGLSNLASKLDKSELPVTPARGQFGHCPDVSRYLWSFRSQELDTAIEQVCSDA